MTEATNARELLLKYSELPEGSTAFEHLQNIVSRTGIEVELHFSVQDVAVDFKQESLSLDIDTECCEANIAPVIYKATPTGTEIIAQISSNELSVQLADVDIETDITETIEVDIHDH